MTISRTYGLVFLLALPLALTTGCPGEDDDDTADDDDMAWPESLAGALNVHTTLAGETLCDATVDLEGTRHEGECEGCDMALDIQAYVSRDDGTEGCVMDPLWTYLPDETAADLVLAHAPAFDVMEWYGPETYREALVTKYTDVDEGTLFEVMLHEDETEGTFTRSDDTISWTFDRLEQRNVDSYYNDCGTIEDSDTEIPPQPDAGAGSTLDCEGAVADVWTVDAAAGESVVVGVDTVAAGTAFDPQMYVNGPDGCTMLVADDSFECTFPPPSYRCPAADFIAEQGSYQIVVISVGSCAGSEAADEIHAAGLAEPNLTLLEDDMPILAEWEISLAGTAALTY